MKWTNFDETDPPMDREVIAYYQNGGLDKGYIIMVRNSRFGYRLPDSFKTYILIKWCLIEDEEN